MKFRACLLSMSVLAIPIALRAQPVDGIYVGAGAGFDYLNALNGKNLVIPVPGVRNQTLPINSANLNSNGGFAGLGSIGYGFGNGLRLEVEGNYRQNRVSVQGSTVVGGGGEYQQYGVMVNGLFDFDVGSPFLFPYAGIGLGYVQNAFNGGTVYSLGTAFPHSPQVNVAFTSSAKGSAAGQGILGVAFPLPGVPGLSVTTEFRFIGQFERQTYQGRTTVAGSTGPGVVGTSLKLAAPTNESFLIGLRYAFNAPVPPPPPAPVVAAPPAVQPARTYLVFFDWDRADLTTRAKEIVAEAATNSTHVQVTRIEVNGYTDLSGTPAYNQKLSVRRAEAVASELIRDGIPRSEITAQGFGESNPLVPTAQGVREPQNRRVEIVLK